MNPILHSILTILVLINNTTATEVRDCPNVEPTIFVDIHNCTVPPCELPQLKAAIMDITFRVPKYHVSFSPKVKATVLGLSTNYPLDSNGCDNLLNGYCPILETEVLIYHFEFNILQQFPLVFGDIEFSLVSNTNETITCFQVRIRIVQPRDEQVLLN